LPRNRECNINTCSLTVFEETYSIKYSTNFTLFWLCMEAFTTRASFYICMDYMIFLVHLFVFCDNIISYLLF
jgi:predicted nucleic acid binding AN1-type Zn finger protein